jgi:hypothetical protein
MHWPVNDLLKWYQDITPGTTVRRNHDDCPSGVDRRRRLYVSKTPDNTKLKCFCHNCGNGTVIDLPGAVKLRPVTHRMLLKPEAPELPPRWAEPPQPRLHPRHKLWLSAYGILTNVEAGVYSASDMELVFPMQGGHQIRYFDRKPKWKCFGHPICYQIKVNAAVLVCEDIISGGKWAHTEGVSGGFIALLGHRPSLKPEEAAQLDGLPAVIVWLDNDKPSVVEAAQSLAHATGPRTVLIEGGTDPKRYPKSELKKVHDVCIELVKSPPADGRPYHVLQILPPGQGVCA